MIGYDVKDGKIYINPEGAEVVRRIFHKYTIEHKGTCTIARELKGRVFVLLPTRTGLTQ